ncbi:hypothetical protein M426DRAFT_250300 [Hypoxylon sp. CI-4A]|nr:hypothetical protein M426DRAFT_250300 [Hypoxylon sp. CI-4A]
MASIIMSVLAVQSDASLILLIITIVEYLGGVFLIWDHDHDSLHPQLVGIIPHDVEFNTRYLLSKVYLHWRKTFPANAAHLSFRYIPHINNLGYLLVTPARLYASSFR